jgi:hypothetical protein
MSESSNNPIDALIALIQSQLLDVNTAIPAVIVSYADGKATVTPLVKKRFADGDVLDFPSIPGVRVCWPSFAGGLAGVKGPVTPGDKCLLIIAQQAIDGTDDRRMFDLQDAYALMTDLGAAGNGDSGNNDDLTMFFGTAHIRLTKAGELQINAPGGTTIKTTTLTAEASESVTMDTPQTTTTAALTAQGLLTYAAGMSGQGGGAGTSIGGDIAHTGGQINSNGVILHTHQHSGVQAGPSNSGPPV